MPLSTPSRMSSWLIFSTSVLSLCVIASTLLSAQSTGGRILGRVADSSGAVLAGVKVTATNEATGVSRDTVTNENGDYGFPQVPVGTYTVSFDLQGFKTNVRKGILVDLNEVITLNGTLQIGETKETVEVTSEAPLVDTTSTQLGSVMDSRQVSGLPLNSRDTYQLLQLQPGVQGVGGSDLFYGSNTAGAVSVNGGRGRSNNFSVNGGDGNDLFVNGPAIEPSPDSIEEFRVISNTFDAEYGRNSGAVINVVTKSGTNQLHGSFYEFFRNDVLDSKGFLDPATPDNKQNQFGGTIGGPIRKDRTFIFGSYEGRRIVQGIVGDPTVVPTADERNGDFSQSPFGGVITDNAVADILQQRPGCLSAILAVPGAVTPNPGVAWGGPGGVFPNSQIPTVCFDPVSANLMTQYVPLPNSASQPNIFQSIPHAQQHGNQFTVKLDHHINDRQNLSVYYYFNDAYDAEPFTKFQAESTNLLPGFGDLNKTRSQQVNISHTWTLSTTVVNEARFTYFREGQGTFLSPQNHHLVTDSCTGAAVPFCFTGTTDTPNVIPSNPAIGITPGLGAQHEGVPNIDVSGGFTIGNDFEGELPQIGNTYQLSDNLTKVMGNHTMKFGVDLRVQRFLQTLFFSPQGDYDYEGGGLNDFVSVRNSDQTSNLFPNYLMGLPDTDLIGSTNSEDVRGRAIYLFAQDSWKVRPNITLNYGLRWEYNEPFYDAGGRYQTFRPGQTSTVYPCTITPAGDCPVGLVVPGDPGVPRGLTQPYYRSFAPRIGIAWDPAKDGKMTVRAGFGIFYNPIEQLVLEQFQAEPPFGGSTTITEGFFATPFVLQSCDTPPAAGSCTGNGASGGPGVLPNPFGSILNPPRGTPIDWSVFRPIVLFGELQPKLRSQYTEQYNLGIEREVMKNTVLTIGYVGSQGHHLLATHDLSPANAQTCLDIIASLGSSACGPFFGDSQIIIPAGTTIAPQGLHLPYGPTPFIPGGTVLANQIDLVGLRQYSSPQCNPITGSLCPVDGLPVFSSIYAQDTIANSAYNSLQASLERKFSNGLQFEVAYTYSKSIDDASSFENALKPICNGVLNNFSCNRALSLFDARNRLVISYLWQLPVPKYSGAKGQLLDGWAVSGITSFQSGFPIRMQTLDDQELENDTSGFEAPGRPIQTGPVTFLNPRSNGNYYFCNPASTCPFQDPPLGSLGGARTVCCGPGINNFDMSVQKGIPIGEAVHAEFRAEFFNIFNHTQFLNPDGDISDGPDFGRVTHTRDPRQVQFALKFSF